MELFFILLGTYGVFVLQNALFSGYVTQSNPFHIIPIAMALYIMMGSKKIKASYLGLFIGFLCDVLYGQRLGFYMLIWFLLGEVGEKIYGYLNSRSFLTAGILSGLLAIFYGFITGLGYFILGHELPSTLILQNTFHKGIFLIAFSGGLIYFLIQKINFSWVRRRTWKK